MNVFMRCSGSRLCPLWFAFIAQLAPALLEYALKLRPVLQSMPALLAENGQHRPDPQIGKDNYG
jgi:hypothetical protein